MTAFLQTTLSNTLLAALLALAALFISRTFRRPALSHALWLLVLLKLITPPLFNIPLKLLPSDSPQQKSNRTAPILPASQAQPPQSFPASSAPLDDNWLTLPLIESPTSPPPTLPSPHPPTSPPNWPLYISLTWLTGSLLCILLIIYRLARFQKLLRFSTPADSHIQNLTRSLSHKLGLSHTPAVHLIPGPLYPMLWSLTPRPKLLIPSQLWSRLDDAQRQTLLLHELAHYRRRDHLIRALELLITIIYWWNPIAWLARHQLREAEEQCCDAWVLSTLPRSARDYASALLEAIDFVSNARPGFPMLASPMGEFHDMKRRLLMIKHHESQNAPTGRSLTWPAFSALSILALILLPLSTSLAQQDQPAPPPATSFDPARRALDEVARDPLTQAQPAQPAQPPAGIAPLPPAPGPARRFGEEGDMARALEQELQQTRDEIARLNERLQLARARLAQLQAALHPDAPAAGVGLPGARAVNPAPTRARPGTLIMPDREVGIGNFNKWPNLPDANPDQERRLRTVEEKLDLLIDELRRLRQDRPERLDDPAPIRR